MPQNPAAWPARSSSGGGQQGTTSLGRSQQPEVRELGAPATFLSDLPPPMPPPSRQTLLHVYPGTAWAGISHTAPAERHTGCCDAHRDTPSAWHGRLSASPPTARRAPDPWGLGAHTQGVLALWLQSSRIRLSERKLSIVNYDLGSCICVYLPHL